MKRRGTVLLYGFVLWLIPFIVAFAIFPVRESNRPLFESIMPVVLCAATVVLARAYFSRIDADFRRAGLTVGITWMVICVVLDLLLFTWGPMTMTLGAYMADIGLTYFIIPIVTTGMGRIIEKHTPSHV